MSVLIVYYSRDGHTETVAKAMAEDMGADLRKIEEEKNRKGILGYIRAGRDGMRQKKSKLKDPDFDITKYGTVFFGAPIWGWKPAPATMTMMDSMDMKGKKVVNFVTMGGSCGKSLEIMGDLAKTKGGEVIGSYSIITQKVSDDDLKQEAKRIAAELRKKLD